MSSAPTRPASSPPSTIGDIGGGRRGNGPAIRPPISRTASFALCSTIVSADSLPNFPPPLFSAKWNCSTPDGRGGPRDHAREFVGAAPSRQAALAGMHRAEVVRPIASSPGSTFPPDFELMKTPSPPPSWMKSATMTCADAARLASESLDRPTSSSERFFLRIHLWYCRHCRRHEHSIRRLGVLARATTSIDEIADPPRLPDEVKERIRRLLRSYLVTRGIGAAITPPPSAFLPGISSSSGNPWAELA